MASPELADATNGLYHRLQEPKPARIEGCPCCTDKDELCRILETPRDALTANDLFDFVMSAFYTMGDAASFRYFLPRILDIAACSEAPRSPFDIEIVLHKLKLANWQAWPDREREAVRRVLRAWFGDIIHSDELDGGTIDSMICGLALSGDPLTPYFSELLDNPEALKCFFAENAHSFYAKGKLSNDFWSGDREAMLPVVAWLKSPPVQAVISSG